MGEVLEGVLNSFEIVGLCGRACCFEGGELGTVFGGLRLSDVFVIYGSLFIWFFVGHFYKTVGWRFIFLAWATC